MSGRLEGKKILVRGLELGNAVFTEFQGDLSDYKIGRASCRERV